MCAICEDDWPHWSDVIGWTHGIVRIILQFISMIKIKLGAARQIDSNPRVGVDTLAYLRLLRSCGTHCCEDKFL